MAKSFYVLIQVDFKNKKDSKRYHYIDYQKMSFRSGNEMKQLNNTINNFKNNVLTYSLIENAYDFECTNVSTIPFQTKKELYEAGLENVSRFKENGSYLLDYKQKWNL